MKQNNISSRLISTLLVIVLTALIMISDENIVYADMPYDTYSYNYWGEDVLQPHAYLYSDSITSNEMGTTLSYPKDLFLYNEHLYIADTDNSRVLKISLTGQLILSITYGKDKEDLLNKPQGVFVTDEGHIYVADTDNGRILEFDNDGNYIREIGRPVTALIPSTQEYKPLKVVVDGSERIYVSAYGINLGLIEFSRDGSFSGFMGATKVSVNRFEYIWKSYFSTEAQQARMETIIPTEYSNIFVDDRNFLYTTISNLSDSDHENKADAVRRLNPTGNDVLRRLGNNPIIGDLLPGKYTKWSVFTDISATEYGCYFILDSGNCKIFAYDYDGNSLFCFGAKGSRIGTMKSPVGLVTSKNADKIYVLDTLEGCIYKYKITEYGRHLLSALELNNRGDAIGSCMEWNEVLKANANSELAYIGLGKNSLKQGQYKDAMHYFKLGNSRKYYTKAFYFYRKTVMEENFGKFMFVIISILIIILIFSMIKKIKRWVGEVHCIMSKR